MNNELNNDGHSTEEASVRVKSIDADPEVPATVTETEEKVLSPEPFSGVVTLFDNVGIKTLFAIDEPDEYTVHVFNHLTAYGIYMDKFPLIIWQFGNEWLLASPFNPEAGFSQNPEGMNLFFSGQANIFTRILSDQYKNIISTRYFGLDQDFIGKLIEAWLCEYTDWSKYTQWFNSVSSRVTIEQLWEKSVKYVNPHIIIAPYDKAA